MQPLPSLTDAEKHTIVATFGHLHAAIAGGLADDDVAQHAIAFQRAYHGASRPLVDDFGAAADKVEWARQVRLALASELGRDLLEWSDGSRSVVPDDASLTSLGLDAEGSAAPAGAPGSEVVLVDATCAHCDAALIVRCAPMPGHPVITEHDLTCPRCGRLTALHLPGAVIDVVADATS